MTPKQKEWTAQRAGIYALSEKGLTYAEIGKHFDISKQRVQQVLDKHYSVRRRALSPSPSKSIDKKKGSR